LSETDKPTATVNNTVIVTDRQRDRQVDGYQVARKHSKAHMATD